MRAFINGELVTDGNSGVMMHSFPEIVAYASQDETRRPGDFIGSGTVGGGCGLELRSRAWGGSATAWCSSADGMTGPGATRMGWRWLRRR